MTTESLWRCPKCGREFAPKNQWHSCVSRTVDDHSQGKATSLEETLDYLFEKTKEFGPIRVDAVKSSINIAGRSHWGGVKVLKDSLKLGFMLDRPWLTKGFSKLRSSQKAATATR